MLTQLLSAIIYYKEVQNTIGLITLFYRGLRFIEDQKTYSKKRGELGRNL